jgi:CspA family cold shock protein
MVERFRLLIGAKRQVTLPARLLHLLSLQEGSQLQIDVDGDHISIVPLVSVPRHLVSPAVMREMESRRGIKDSDISLAEFARELRQEPVKTAPVAASLPQSPRQSSMAAGTVRWFNDAKGFGFITPEGGGEDLLVNSSAVQSSGFKCLEEGQRVLFKTITTPQGVRQVAKIETH